MFVAINDKDKTKVEKLVRIEREYIIKTYTFAITINKLDLLDDYKLQHEENKITLQTCHDYLTRSKFAFLTYKEIIKYLRLNIVKNSHFLFLEILECVIDQNDFIRAKKMILWCKKKEFYSFKYFILKKRYYKERKVTKI